MFRDALKVTLDPSAYAPLDQALRRLKRQVDRAGVLVEFRRRQEYTKPSLRRRLKSARARRRLERRQRREQLERRAQPWRPR
jgi:small subunit ribosomal protein S21